MVVNLTLVASCIQLRNNSACWDIDDGNIPTHPVRTYTDKIMMWKHSYMPENTPDTSNIITPISVQWASLQGQEGVPENTPRWPETVGTLIMETFLHSQHTNKENSDFGNLQAWEGVSGNTPRWLGAVGTDNRNIHTCPKTLPTHLTS